MEVSNFRVFFEDTVRKIISVTLDNITNIQTIFDKKKSPRRDSIKYL